MNHHPAVHATLLLMLAIVALPLAAQGNEPGFADPVLGRWDLTVSGPDGEYPSWLEIRLRREDQLMGRFVGRFGSVRHITELDYQDGNLHFAIPVQYEPMAENLTFTGRLANDQLAGTTVEASGETVSWTGVRAPVLQAEGNLSSGQQLALFNGRDLTGWSPRFESRPGCWSVVDGVLESRPPCVDLISDQQFEDFTLSLEFSYPAGSNSGVYLRGRYEVQIQDTAGTALDPLRMGGVYGFLAPSLDAAGQAGDWQTLDITLVGRRITIVLNGQTVVADQIIPGITGGALNSDEASPGPIMLQGDHGPIRFRRIELTELQ
jgi:hypothetical protein